MRSRITAVLILFVVALPILGVYNSLKHKLCFYSQLSEAINLNKLRKTYYANVSQGASTHVSEKLIDQESATI